LAVFAIVAGWAGIPEDFPLLGPILDNNYIHHVIGATVHSTLHHLHEAGLVGVGYSIEVFKFTWLPLITSIVVAVGGLFFGWLVYARKPLEQGQSDPLIKALGPLHTFLNRKWYWDELYDTVFIQPTIFVSETVVYEWIDKGFIDGIIHLVARAFYGFGRYVRAFEMAVFGDGVDWVKDQFLAMAASMRQLQTGRIQEYVLVSTLIASALAFVVLAINYGWFDQIFQ